MFASFESEGVAGKWSLSKILCPRAKSQKGFQMPLMAYSIVRQADKRCPTRLTTHLVFRGQHGGRMALIAGRARKLVDHGNRAAMPVGMGSILRGFSASRACITV